MPATLQRAAVLSLRQADSSFQGHQHVELAASAVLHESVAGLAYPISDCNCCSRCGSRSGHEWPNLQLATRLIPLER